MMGRMTIDQGDQGVDKFDKSKDRSTKMTMLVRICKSEAFYLTIRIFNDDFNDDPIDQKSWQQQSCRSGLPS